VTKNGPRNLTRFEKILKSDKGPTTSERGSTIVRFSRRVVVRGIASGTAAAVNRAVWRWNEFGQRFVGLIEFDLSPQRTGEVGVVLCHGELQRLPGGGDRVGKPPAFGIGGREVSRIIGFPRRRVDWPVAPVQRLCRHFATKSAGRSPAARPGRSEPGCARFKRQNLLEMRDRLLKPSLVLQGEGEEWWTSALSGSS